MIPVISALDTSLTLQKAYFEALRTGKSIPVSLVARISSINPLAFFQAGEGMGEVRVFWHDPTDGLTLVALGSAWTVTGEGETRFSQVRKYWEELIQEAWVEGERVAPATGPLLLGGFAFDPARPWEEFPNGLMFLPRILLTSWNSSQWITLSVVIGPESNPVQESKILESLTHRLLAADALRLQSVRVSPEVEEVVPERWMESAEEVLKRVRRGEVQKAVFAQKVQVRIPEGFEPASILLSLTKENPFSTTFAIELGGITFLGATPEQLAKMKEGQVKTMTLAGSSSRGGTSVEDEQLGKELLSCPKNRKEHQIVVDAIRDRLKPLCLSLEVPEEPSLLKFPTVQHLFTSIRGRLRLGSCLLDVVESLHPTPSMGGFPREESLEVIREIERWERGWYAGPFGWMDEKGEGNFVVAIRSGLIKDRRTELFAGCGIISESDPKEEYKEWWLKLQALLSALGVS